MGIRLSCLDRLRLGLALICLSAFGFAAQAAEPKEALSRVEDQMAAQKKQAAALDEKAVSAAADLEKLRTQATEAAKSFQEKQGKLEELDDKLEDLENSLEQRSAGADAAQAQLTTLARALARLVRLPPGVFLLNGPALDETIHRGILLRALVPQLHDRAQALAGEMIEISALRQSVAQEKRLAIAARQNVAWQKAKLEQLVAARQGLLQKTTAEKEEIARQLAALTDEAKDLRQLLDKVNRRAAQGPEGRHDKDSASMGSGLLLPVSGKIVQAFGAKDAYGLPGQGVTYAAPPGSPVVAPRAGRIVFVGPFRGYGQIVIVQHAGGAHSLLAGFGRIDAEMGQKVEAGEPLGILPAKADDSKGSARLYFEWRQHGEAADPALVKGKGR